MILDTFKPAQVVVQIDYAPALELWDSAGRVNRRVQKIWPDAQVVPDQVSPANVTLRSPKAQIDTGVTRSTIALSRLTTIDHVSTQQVVDTFAAWRSELALTKLNRVSTRVIYIREFPALRSANEALLAFGLCRWPKSKVFDQPEESDHNSFDLVYRFEDEASFSFLRVRTEQIKLELKVESDIGTLKEASDIKNRLIIDFDRGLKQSIDAASFRMDEWLKGFVHVLRRDVEKVLKESP